MLQKALILSILLIPTMGYGTPCDDAKKDYNFARKYGAHSFYCTDQYDGSSTSFWSMSPEDYQKFKEALILKNRDRIKGPKNGGKK